MSNRFRVLALALGLAACSEGQSSQLDPSVIQKQDPLTGAIFTTTSDGTVVDENVHYANKCDVYLSGGPKGPGQPGLPEGDYFFQITDPSGKTLLSTDPVMNRQVHVGPDGCITGTSGAGNHLVSPDTKKGGSCVVVQTCPYLDSPNNGDEYKAWMTRIEDFNPDAKNDKHGFVPSESKTDNFKVRLAPDAGVPSPDAAPPSPDAAPPSPDAEVPQPDAEVPQPDAGVSPPGADAAPRPDAEEEQPPPQPED